MNNNLKFKKHFIKKKLKKHLKKYKKYKIDLDFNLIATTSGNIFPKQIESIRKLIAKKRKRFGFLNIKIKPHIPLTKKPNEVRMGKGKGSFFSYIYPIKQNQILCSLTGISEKQIKIIFKKANFKLPIKTKIEKKQILQIK